MQLQQSHPTPPLCPTHHQPYSHYSYPPNPTSPPVLVCSTCLTTPSPTTPLNYTSLHSLSNLSSIFHSTLTRYFSSLLNCKFIDTTITPHLREVGKLLGEEYHYIEGIQREDVEKYLYDVGYMKDFEGNMEYIRGVSEKNEEQGRVNEGKMGYVGGCFRHAEYWLKEAVGYLRGNGREERDQHPPPNPCDTPPKLLPTSRLNEILLLLSQQHNSHLSTTHLSQQLQHSLHLTTQQLATSTQKNLELTSELQKLNRELSLRVKTCLNLHQQSLKKNQEEHKYKSIIFEITEELNGVKGKLKDCKEVVGEKDKVVRKLRDEIREREEKEEVEREGREEIERLRKVITEVTNANTLLQTQNTSLQTLNSKLKADFEDISSQNVIVNNKLTELRKEIQKSKLSTSLYHKESIKVKDEGEREKEGLRGKIKALEEGLQKEMGLKERWLKQVKEKEGQVEQREEEIRGLRGMVRELEKEMEREREEGREIKRGMEQSLQDCFREIDELKLEKNETFRVIQELQKEKKEAAREINEGLLRQKELETKLQLEIQTRLELQQSHRANNQRQEQTKPEQKVSSDSRSDQIVRSINTELVEKQMVVEVCVRKGEVKQGVEVERKLQNGVVGEDQSLDVLNTKEENQREQKKEKLNEKEQKQVQMKKQKQQQKQEQKEQQKEELKEENKEEQKVDQQQEKQEQICDEINEEDQTDQYFEQQDNSQSLQQRRQQKEQQKQQQLLPSNNQQQPSQQQPQPELPPIPLPFSQQPTQQQSSSQPNQTVETSQSLPAPATKPVIRYKKQQSLLVSSELMIPVPNPHVFSRRIQKHNEIEEIQQRKKQQQKQKETDKGEQKVEDKTQQQLVDVVKNQNLKEEVRVKKEEVVEEIVEPEVETNGINNEELKGQNDEAVVESVYLSMIDHHDYSIDCCDTEKIADNQPRQKKESEEKLETIEEEIQNQQSKPESSLNVLHQEYKPSQQPYQKSHLKSLEEFKQSQDFVIPETQLLDSIFPIPAPLPISASIFAPAISTSLDLSISSLQPNPMINSTLIFSQHQQTQYYQLPSPPLFATSLILSQSNKQHLLSFLTNHNIQFDTIVQRFPTSEKHTKQTKSQTMQQLKSALSRKNILIINQIKQNLSTGILFAHPILKGDREQEEKEEAIVFNYTKDVKMLYNVEKVVAGEDSVAVDLLGKDKGNFENEVVFEYDGEEGVVLVIKRKEGEKEGRKRSRGFEIYQLMREDEE